MSYNKLFSYLFIFFFCVYSENLSGQALNIIGDTIFANRESEIQLVFPTHPISFKTVPEDNQFLVWDSRTGINLIAGSENYDPVTLLISEAERKHRFILKFKKEISNKEAKLYYDYSTVKKLAQHIRETTFPRFIEQPKTALKTEPVKKDNRESKKEVAILKPADSASNYYYALLAEGDKNLQLQNYQDARLNFEKAHTLRPEDVIPLQRLEEIKNKIGDKGELEQKDNYNNILADAKNKLDQKNYTEAADAYTRALQLKPGDAFITRQLQKVRNLIAVENAQKEKEKARDLNNEITAKAQYELKNKKLSDQKNYDSSVRSADNFFKSGDYENAKKAYNNALSLFKKDWPRDQINKINKILIAQVAQANEEAKKMARQKMAAEQKLKIDSIVKPAEIKKRYNIAMANGKSSYLKNELFSAKTFYEEASGLQPLQGEPKNQLKIINSKLDDSVREAVITDKYDRTIDLADSLVNAKAFDSAVTIYKQASLIKPMESYPRKQLKYMYSELAQIEKNKRAEKEREYSDALTRADKAVADKKYADAKSAYLEALAIHSDNEYAKRRLEIISYQLEVENARIEKLKQDSLKEIPVKKTKKRKSAGK